MRRWQKTRLIVNVTSYREEQNVIYINLPILVNEMPEEFYLQFIHLFVHRFTAVLLHYMIPEFNYTPKWIANVIIEQFISRSDGFFALYPAMRTEMGKFSQFAFLRTIMKDRRASKFLNDISKFAFMVDFDEPSKRNQFVSGTTNTNLAHSDLSVMNQNFATKEDVKESVTDFIQYHHELFSSMGRFHLIFNLF